MLLVFNIVGKHVIGLRVRKRIWRIVALREIMLMVFHMLLENL
jgi:hypothetical protein